MDNDSQNRQQNNDNNISNVLEAIPGLTSEFVGFVDLTLSSSSAATTAAAAEPSHTHIAVDDDDEAPLLIPREVAEMPDRLADLHDVQSGDVQMASPPPADMPALHSVDDDSSDNDTDVGMPALQDVSDSDSEFSESDSEEDEVMRMFGQGSDEMPALEPVTGTTRRRDSNGDDDRDRRHPSERVSGTRLPGPPPPPPPPPSQTQQQQQQQRREDRQNATNQWRVFDFPPITTTVTMTGIPGGDSDGDNVQPNAQANAQPFTLNTIFEQLMNGAGLREVREKEDPVRAKRIVDALEEIPIGLVQRIERVSTADTEASGGDGGCAICWEKLLSEDIAPASDATASLSVPSENIEHASSEAPPPSSLTDIEMSTAPSASSLDSLDTTTSAPEQTASTSSTQPQKIVSLPCSHVFHSSCLIPWFSRPRQTTCPTCRFNLDPHNLTYRRSQRQGATLPAQGGDVATPEEEENTTEFWGGFFTLPPLGAALGGDGDGGMFFGAGGPNGGAQGAEGAPAQQQPTIDFAEILRNQAAAFLQREGQREYRSFIRPWSVLIIYSAPEATANVGQQPAANEGTGSQPPAGVNVPGAPTEPQPQSQPTAAGVQAQTDASAQPQPAPNPRLQGQNPGSQEANIALNLFRSLFAGAAAAPPPAGGPGPNPAGGAAPAADGHLDATITFGFDVAFPPLDGDGDFITQLMNHQRAMDAQNPAPNAAADDAPPAPAPTPANPQHPPAPRAALPFMHLPVFGMNGTNPVRNRWMATGPNNGTQGGNGNLPPFMAALRDLVDAGAGVHNPVPNPDGAASQAAPTPTQAPVDPAPTAAPVDLTPAPANPVPSPTTNPTPDPAETSTEATATATVPAPPPPPAPAAFHPLPLPPFMLPRAARRTAAPADPNNPRPPRQANRRHRREWTLPPPPPGRSTLRERVEKREREMGLRCCDVSCGVGPSDEDPYSGSPELKQVRIFKEEGEREEAACGHLFHPSCLVSAQRVALQGAPEKGVGQGGRLVEVQCPTCRVDGVVSREVWEEGCRE